ncbi:MAG: fumarylacetoacetate hydrolase family protein [Rhodospirillales bacterium]
MKIVRFVDTDSEPLYGVLDGSFIHPLPDAPWFGMGLVGEPVPLAVVRLVEPLEAGRIFCVGLNYRAHAAEMNLALPERPMLFTKPSTTVVGPDAAIIYPREAELVHHEAELAVIIGREGRRIPEGAALDHVFGYTAANDVSERVIQKSEMASGALLIAKGYDSFCPLGPVIETELDPGSLSISCRVNGAVRQNSNTADFIFSVPRIIACISAAITLLPGDIILTGTPSGVGPIRPGDQVEVEIEGIGVLQNSVVAEDQAA